MTTPIPRGTQRSRSRPLARLLALTLMVLTAGIGLAGPAAAHNVLISSDPADGAVVQAAPTQITLTFDEAVQDFQPVVTVLGPDGQRYESGAPQVDSTVVTTPLGPLTAAGDYVIAYRVVSADGHPVQGEVQFSFAAAPPPSSSSASTAPTSTAPTGSSGSPASSALVTGSPSSGASGDSTASSASAAPTTAVSAAPSTAEVAPASSSSGLSGWAWVAIAVIAALIAAAAVVIIRRRGSSDSGGV